MFSNLNTRVKLMTLATFIIALIAIPLTIIQVQKQQETRQHAASPDSVSFNLNPQSTKGKAGESFDTDVHLLNASEKDISSVDVTIQYDSSILGASFQPNKETGYTTIINEVKDNTIHYVAVNSSRNPIIGTDLTLGTLTLTGKVDGKGKVSLENIQVTASGNSSSLVIDTLSTGTTEREYTIGDIEPSSAIASPTPAPSSAPTYACAPAGGQCTSVSTACGSLGSYVWGGYGSDYCPYNFRPQCCLPVVAPAPDQSQTYNQCLKICDQGFLLAPGTFDKSTCIQECDSKYKQPESATVLIRNKPDLSITDVKFRKKPTTSLAEIIVKNIGDADVIRNTNDIEVSIGGTNSSFGSLKTGESITIKIIDMTGKMIDGQQIIFIVDVTNVIDEINEINNKFTTTVKFEKVCQTSTQFDLNKDDKVDENDASICKVYLGKEVNEESAKCDFNGDCNVDSEDLYMHASKAKPTVTLDTDTIGLAGGEIKVAVTAKNDYYGIDSILLFYGYDGDVSSTFYENCGGQKSCTKGLSINVQKSGKFYLAANTINSVPGNNLISYYPMEDYISLKEGQTVKFDSKEIGLISVSRDQKGIIENLKIRIGNSFEDVKFGNRKFVGGMLFSPIFAQSKPFDEITFMVIKPKTVDIMDLKSAVIPEKGSPGTMFTITAKLETPEKFSVLARIQSPSAKETALQLYDDGNHGDDKANDGFYANTITESEIGTYFVTLVGEDKKGKIEVSNAASFTVSDLQSNCMPITKNGDVSNLIDVVFALNNYAGSDKNEVSKVISRHADFLFSKEPFKSNKDNFNLYYLGESHETDCGFAVGDICISSFQKAVSSACPFYDEIIVLDKKGLSSTVTVDGVQGEMSAGGYSRPRTAVVGTASAAGTEGVTVHEFGHSFGWLADEYDAPWVGFSNTNAANCDTFACPKWCSGKSDSIEKPMCYKLSTEQECKGKSYNGVNCAWSAFDGGKTTKCDFPYSSNVDFGIACRDDTKCLYGCGGSAGYRSSKYSIMGDTNKGKVNDYNTISKQQIQKIIDNWGKGK